MPIPFRTYLAREAALVATFNASVNAAYTGYLWRSAEPLRLLGPDGVALDLAATPVVIAVLSTLLGTAVVRRKIRDGRIAVEPGTRAPWLLRRLPGSIPGRAAAAALGAAVLLALPLLIVLPALGDGALTLAGAVGTKVAITVVLSLLIVPTLTLAALADVQRPPSRVAAA